MDISSVIIGKKYRIGETLGEGTFGVVYAGMNIETDTDVAIKIEDTACDRKASILHLEIQAYRKLQGVGGALPGFPRIRWTGWCNAGRVLVMDRLGDNLETLFNHCGRVFSTSTLLQIADQVLRRIECLHDVSLLHRDIKPENFLMGADEASSLVYLVDLGLVKQYRDDTTHCHILYREGKHMTGTPRYASINTHLGIEQSRRDDLEAIGYMLLYFVRGRLPWQGLSAATRQKKYDRIMEVKLATSVARLCAGLPEEFVTYFEYVRALRFADRPHYRYLRGLFRQVADREGVVYDGVFDWHATLPT
jgi:serine/threonine protein kinase